MRKPLTDEELVELQDPDTWDWESAERHPPNPNARAVVRAVKVIERHERRAVRGDSQLGRADRMARGVRGGEIGKTRPAVIVSNDVANERRNRVQVVPLTSNLKQVLPWEARVEVRVNCRGKAERRPYGAQPQREELLHIRVEGGVARSQ